jgi:multidrug efflux pump subunit AcrB
MISRFFIERPRFAFVIAFVITLAGLVALFALPVTQYPDITPGQVSITATYPGADAKTVQETVIQPIEPRQRRDTKMITCRAGDRTGCGTITVTFASGRTATSTRQHAETGSTGFGQLPHACGAQCARRPGKSPSILMIVALYSPDGIVRRLFLNKCASIDVRMNWRAFRRRQQ